MQPGPEKSPEKTRAFDPNSPVAIVLGAALFFVVALYATFGAHGRATAFREADPSVHHFVTVRLTGMTSAVVRGDSCGSLKGSIATIKRRQARTYEMLEALLGYKTESDGNTLEKLDELGRKNERKVRCFPAVKDIAGYIARTRVGIAEDYLFLVDGPILFFEGRVHADWPDIGRVYPCKENITDAAHEYCVDAARRSSDPARDGEKFRLRVFCWRCGARPPSPKELKKSLDFTVIYRGWLGYMLDGGFMIDEDAFFLQPGGSRDAVRAYMRRQNAAKFKDMMKME